MKGQMLMGNLHMKIGNLSVQLPSPTHEVGLSTREFVEGRSTRVVRTPRVTEHESHVVLDFESLGGDLLERNGRDESLTTVIRHRPDIQTIHDARRHFVREHPSSAFLATEEEKSTKVFRSETHPFGTVLTIDLGEADFIPGNTYVYVLLKSPLNGALCFSPTHYLSFDWGRLIVERSPS